MITNFKISENFINDMAKDLWSSDLIYNAISILDSAGIVDMEEQIKLCIGNVQTKKDILKEIKLKEEVVTKKVINTFKTLQNKINEYIKYVGILDQKNNVIIPGKSNAEAAIYRMNSQEHQKNIETLQKQLMLYLKDLEILFLYQNKHITSFPFDALIGSFTINESGTNIIDFYKTDCFVEDAWISPEGVVYNLTNLKFPKHLNFVDLLIDSGIIPDINLPEKYLENNNWFKISHSSFIFAKSLTQKQIDLISDWFYKYKWKKVKVYTEYITLKDIIEQYGK